MTILAASNITDPSAWFDLLMLAPRKRLEVFIIDAMFCFALVVQFHPFRDRTVLQFPSNDMCFANFAFDTNAAITGVQGTSPKDASGFWI
jgi:hypothetical protein